MGTIKFDLRCWATLEPTFGTPFSGVCNLMEKEQEKKEKNISANIGKTFMRSDDILITET